MGLFPQDTVLFGPYPLPFDDRQVKSRLNQGHTFNLKEVYLDDVTSRYNCIMYKLQSAFYFGDSDF